MVNFNKAPVNKRVGDMGESTTTEHFQEQNARASTEVEPELEVLPEPVSALLIRRPPQKSSTKNEQIMKNPSKIYKKHEMFAPGGTNWRPRTLGFFQK